MDTPQKRKYPLLPSIDQERPPLDVNRARLSDWESPTSLNAVHRESVDNQLVSPLRGTRVDSKGKGIDSPAGISVYGNNGKRRHLTVSPMMAPIDNKAVRVVRVPGHLASFSVANLADLPGVEVTVTQTTKPDNTLLKWGKGDTGNSYSPDKISGFEVSRKRVFSDTLMYMGTPPQPKVLYTKLNNAHRVRIRPFNPFSMQCLNPDIRRKNQEIKIGDCPVSGKMATIPGSVRHGKLKSSYDLGNDYLLIPENQSLCSDASEQEIDNNKEKALEELNPQSLSNKKANQILISISLKPMKPMDQIPEEDRYGQ